MDENSDAYLYEDSTEPVNDECHVVEQLPDGVRITIFCDTTHMLALLRNPLARLCMFVIAAYEPVVWILSFFGGAPFTPGIQQLLWLVYVIPCTYFAAGGGARLMTRMIYEARSSGYTFKYIHRFRCRQYRWPREQIAALRAVLCEGAETDFFAIEIVTNEGNRVALGRGSAAFNRYAATLLRRALKLPAGRGLAAGVGQCG